MDMFCPHTEDHHVKCGRCNARFVCAYCCVSTVFCCECGIIFCEYCAVIKIQIPYGEEIERRFFCGDNDNCHHHKY